MSTGGLRRQPRQQRSRAMVERIVAAARDLLVSEGYDAFSTNRVAARAQVSPGSLYQYFPDKAALVAVVTERWLDQVSDDVAAVLVERLGLEGEQMVRSVVEALLTALERDVALLRVVWEDLPAAAHRARRDQLEGRIADLLTAYLTPRVDRALAAERVRPMAWTVVVALEQLAVRHVLGDPPAMTRARLVDELVALFGAYAATAGVRLTGGEAGDGTGGDGAEVSG